MDPMLWVEDSRPLTNRPLCVIAYGLLFCLLCQKIAKEQSLAWSQSDPGCSNLSLGSLGIEGRKSLTSHHVHATHREMHLSLCCA